MPFPKAVKNSCLARGGKPSCAVEEIDFIGGLQRN
jgi:hypothetical protein